eukprot:s1184_g34.t1
MQMRRPWFKLSKTQLAKSLLLAKVAFCSAYLPGNADEAPMVQAFKDAIGKEPSASELACFRFLYHESYAIVSQEMKILVEKSAGSTEVRKLTNVERADRYAKQVKRLSGLSIKGFLEPSDALIDLACTQYDNNRLAYIPWEKCTSRTDEQERDLKKDPMLTLDVSAGRLKLEKKREDAVTEVNSDLRIQQALQRRALAYDQANVISYGEMSKWNDKLMKSRLTDPPPGYARVSFAQLERADRRFFAEICDMTRSGIQTTTDGRPCEKVLKECMFDAEVLHCLQPLPQQSGSQPREQTQNRSQPYQSGSGKGKSGSSPKGKSKGKGGQTMPQAMISMGCRSSTNSGQPICYAYTLGQCGNKVSKGRCDKGYHVCAIPGCGGHHPAKDCPKKSQTS